MLLHNCSIVGIYYQGMVAAEIEENYKCNSENKGEKIHTTDDNLDTCEFQC